MRKEISVVSTNRKTEHLDICLSRDVSSTQCGPSFDDYYFLHNALPEIDLEEIDQSGYLFGKKMNHPLIISSMVGGVPEAAQLNKTLAGAAQAAGVAMGVGSQRCAVEDPHLGWTYQVRDVAPDVLLFANLGAVQLNYGFGPAECIQAVEMIEADALMLHLNPLQEALQPEGNTNFSGLLCKIEQVCSRLSVPVVVKEVGFGISGDAGRRLADAGVQGLDLAGAGGTSWSRVEKYRCSTEKEQRIAEQFSSWGISTVESLRMVRKSLPCIPVIASGGMRDGVQVAKALALGADAAGIALPLLRAAGDSVDAIMESLDTIIRELRLAMFSVGAPTLEELKGTTALQKRTGF